MTLPDYIRALGGDAGLAAGRLRFARRFGVSERAVISWLYGERQPRADIARRVVAETPVTWDGIYNFRQASATTDEIGAGKEAS